MKRKYVKKEKVIELREITKETFDELLKASTFIRPPKRVKQSLIDEVMGKTL